MGFQAGRPDGDHKNDPGRRQPGDAPDTPANEPKPPRIEDPPAAPEPKRPFTVVTKPGRLREDGMVNPERRERRGFASMSPEKQREIASKGGRAAHEKGTAHEWTADEARSAGRKGGQVSRGGRGRLIVSSDGPEVGGPQIASTQESLDANRVE